MYARGDKATPQRHSTFSQYLLFGVAQIVPTFYHDNLEDG